MAPHDTVTVVAKPWPFEPDPRHAAVMVVDMQNDSVSQGGMFARAGVRVAQIRAAIAPTRRIVEAARQAGVPIVYLKMAFRPDLSDLGPDHGTTHQRHLL